MDCKKPEKINVHTQSLNASITAGAYNAACDKWQAYHDQEMRKKDAEIMGLKNRFISADCRENEWKSKWAKENDRIKTLEAEITRLKRNQD